MPTTLRPHLPLISAPLPYIPSLPCSFCCVKKSSRPGAGGEFWAIKGSWFSIEQDRLFCLLGPNGAGKTTTINCLTGVLPPSGGDALVYGESLSTPGGMDRIRWAARAAIPTTRGAVGWGVGISVPLHHPLVTGCQLFGGLGCRPSIP